MMPFPLRLMLAALLAVFVVCPARADVPYDTEIHLQGLEDAALASTLNDVSQLVALQDRPPPTAAALRRRAEDDLPRLKRVMEASGYWTSQLDYALDPAASPAKVVVTINPGPLFDLAKVVFETSSGAPPTLLDQLGPAAFGLQIGGPARSAPIEAANGRIVEEYMRNGHPFAKIADRKAVIDLGTDTMTVTFSVDPGPPARFGPVKIQGLRRVEPYFVERRIAWRTGTPYDGSAVERTRQDLVQAGLFSSVRITHADGPDAQDEVAMTIDLVEGPPRSVGAGVAYNTNLGLGARAFWEHRNLFGEGEQLRVSAGVAQRQLGLAGNFRRPDLFVRNQDLLVDAELLDETTDAYNSRRFRLYGGLEERRFAPYIFGSGLAVERAYITRSERNENYLLLGAPLYLRRDTTDSLLDPSLGSRQTLTLTPYHGLSGPRLDFLATRGETRFYNRIFGDDRMILASFAALGSIVGAGLQQVPPDKRFYAGGAGSVRGYAYQHAGPLDTLGKPVGGRSSLELGTEFRYRFTETLGIAPFVEGGNVFPTSLPNSGRLFYGGGIGLRYYTIIGPVRLDVGVPFNKRQSDSLVQFYISLGQAF